MDETKKRKAEEGRPSELNKQAKRKKPWRTPRQNQTQDSSSSTSIQPGDAGIWITCSRGKESKCVAEAKDLFEEYARKLYNIDVAVSSDVLADITGEAGIEDDINKELEGLQKPTSTPLFKPIRLDMECVVFFKTEPPLEPCSFVRRICEDASQASSIKHTRFVKRMSPVTLVGKASESGVDAVSKEVLAPHFHQGGPSRKFAIRPTIRNSNLLSRDGVIRQVALAVGPGHSVDLKGYDLLVIVEIYKSICGISVVGKDFDKLKRYNLAEIYDPTTRPEEKLVVVETPKTKG
ncbi:MAG: hypothetical protein M1820_002637 [Bogoriella megaspora]|nr:MAG: hypothetical protein M1820_002637 [Bogoriella megaspora]